MLKNRVFPFAALAVLCISATGFARGGHGGGHHGGGHHGGHHGHHAHHSHVHHHTGHHASFHHGGWHGHHDGLHSWHHGYWGGWGSYPAIWGTGAGLGWAANNYTYRNPFWSDSYAGNVNYAQPITTTSYTDEEPATTQLAGTANPTANQPAQNEVNTNGPAATQIASDATNREATDRDDRDDEDDIGPSENEKNALAQIDAGRAAFRAGNYAEAQKLAEAAIKLWPEDVIAHEFRALTLFAQQKYRESAASVYAVLAGGPGWNEQTLLSFYPDRKQYEEQLADLKRFVRDDPKAADAEFLLAYHQLTAGHRDAARAELERVAQIEPGDKLTAELIKALNVAPATPTKQPKNIEATQLLKAAGDRDPA